MKYLQSILCPFRFPKKQSISSYCFRSSLSRSILTIFTCAHYTIVTLGIVWGLSSNAQAAQEAVMYSSYPFAELEIARKAVKDQHGINLYAVSGGLAATLRRIEAGTAKPAADLFWSSSANTMTLFKDYFEPYQAPALVNIPEIFHYQDHIFQPVGIGIIGMMVNENFLDGNKMPESWADLAKPEWKGKIITTNPENSSTGYSVVYGLSQMLDEDSYKAVIANMVDFEPETAIIAAVASGAYVIALTYEAAPLKYINDGQEEIKMIYPQEGVFVNVEYAGVVKNGPNGEAGKRAIDTLLSKETQVQLLTDSFRRPVRSDIRVSDYLEIPELSDIVIFETDEIAAASVREEVLAHWRSLPKGN